MPTERPDAPPVPERSLQAAGTCLMAELAAFSHRPPARGAVASRRPLSRPDKALQNVPCILPARTVSALPARTFTMTKEPRGTCRTSNKAVIAWVDEMAKHCKPDRVYWCDGSKAERKALTAEAVEMGVLIKLNQKKRPGC